MVGPLAGAEPSIEPSPRGPLPGRLGFWDAVSIIVGIVVGASIFEVPAVIFQNVSGPGLALAVWAGGGALSLVGALCYAELATTYPRSGGDYVYLTRAFGPMTGFLFGWAHLIGILTGSIGALAYVFARYAAALAGWGPESEVWLAAAAVAGLTLLNLTGVVLGKAAQNLLTLAKVLGLAGIVAAGFIGGEGAAPAAAVTGEPANVGLALILVLYAYGGWNDAAFVAAEIRDRRRNIPLALLAGIGGIAALYLLINAALLWGLGFDGARRADGPLATVLLERRFGPAGSTALNVLVMVSALGGLNGLVLTGSRVHASLGADYRVLAPLARWSRRGAPVWSLAAQGVISLALIFAVGTATGHGSIDRLLAALGQGPVAWERFPGGFATLVAATAPVFWFFFLMTGLSVFVLRARDRELERPFRVPLFPLTPILFCITCLYMLWSSVDYAEALALLAAVPLLCGVPLYALSRWAFRRSS